MRTARTGSTAACGRGSLTRALAVAGAILLGLAAAASAQDTPRGLLQPGDAAVTGFSGAVRPRQVAPNVNPAVQTFIDLNGASLRIVDLQTMGGPPRGQLVNARKPFQITAEQIGQVFGVALDNATPPNIYVAATSAFGLHIVVPGPNGQTIHVPNGAPNARFMPGMWGTASGGPGTIWKIDGVTGTVSLFANVVLNGVPNSGPALGGLAFDPDSNTLLVADRDTGVIHRFSLSGTEIGRFDHGTQGRPKQDLPPIAFDPGKRLDIRSGDFRSNNPATWRYAPSERRIFGLGVFRGRLYYAVAAGPQIWSVSLGADGGFDDDATLEIELPPGLGPAEISKITFDDQGRMFLAERPAVVSNYDMHALATAGVGRVLRYALVDSQPGAPRIWQRQPDEYAIGMADNFQNANGGVAIGYDYDATGAIDRGACGGFLWSTGEQLRKMAPTGPAVKISLAPPGNVDGLQGNYVWQVRPENAPPLRAYYVDYDDRFDDDADRGHLGDIAIWQSCAPILRGGWMTPGWLWIPWFVGPPHEPPPPPHLQCPPGEQKPGVQCCPQGMSPDGSGECKPWCPSGAMDPKSQKACFWGFDPKTLDPNNLAKARCVDGSVPVAGQFGGGCLTKSQAINPPICKIGFAKQNLPGVGVICQPVNGNACPNGQQLSPFDNKCHMFCPGGAAWPTKQCCAPDAVLSVTGKCCPAGSKPDPHSGQCVPTLACDPAKGPCPPGIPTCDPAKGPCPPIQTNCDPAKGPCGPLTVCTGPMSSDGTCCTDGGTPNNVGGGCCPPGKTASAKGLCVAITCRAPSKLVGSRCCSPADLQPGGACAPTVCGAGARPVGGSCCDASKIYISNGTAACCVGGTVTNGQCQLGGTPMFPACQPGYSPAGDGTCCLSTQLTSTKVCCPAQQAPTGSDKSQCAPIGGSIPPHGTGDNTGTGIPPYRGQCCMAGLIPVANGSCCPIVQAAADGTCCPAGQRPNRNPAPSINIRGTPTPACVPIQACGTRQTLVNGACCQDANVYQDGNGNPQCCAQPVNAAKQCMPNLQVPTPCAAGSTRMPNGTCCPTNLVSVDGRTCRTLPQAVPLPCGAGQIRTPQGVCVDLPKLKVPPQIVPPRIPPQPTTRPPRPPVRKG